MDVFSSFECLRAMPLCEDRNPDVADYPPGRVPPVVRLVLWNLGRMAAERDWKREG